MGALTCGAARGCAAAILRAGRRESDPGTRVSGLVGACVVAWLRTG